MCKYVGTSSKYAEEKDQRIEHSLKTRTPIEMTVTFFKAGVYVAGVLTGSASPYQKRGL